MTTGRINQVPTVFSVCVCIHTTHNPSLSHSLFHPSISQDRRRRRRGGTVRHAHAHAYASLFVLVRACVRIYIVVVGAHGSNSNNTSTATTTPTQSILALWALSNIIVLVLVAHTPNHSSPLCSIYYTDRERERERVRWLPFKQASDCPFSLYMCARKDEYNQQAHTTTTYHHAVLLAKLPSEMDGRNTCALLLLHITHTHLPIWRYEHTNTNNNNNNNNTNNK